MTGSPTNLKPARPGARYRYSKWRWRILVGAFDLAGGLVAPVWRRLRPARPDGPPRRIVVVQLDHLGDAVLTSPLIGQLRAAYPEATLDVLASPSNHEVFEANPLIDNVRVAERTWFERSPSRRGMAREVWRLGRSLRGERYDLGVDVRGDVLSILVLALAGVRRRVGFAMGGGAFLLTDVADWTAGRHEVRSRLALLEPLGLVPDYTAPTFVHVRDEDRIVIADALREAWREQSPRQRELAGAGGWTQADPPPTNWSADDESSADEPPLLVVHSGAGTAAKRWPRRHWRSLIEKFLRDGWRVVVVGGKEDPPISRILEPHERFLDWSGRLSVRRTTALLERADLYIGADSGPAHLAGSVGTTSVILFSGTNLPRQWRPWSRRSLVLRKRVACAPCHQKVCPLPGHPCMAGIDPERVHKAALRWWRRVRRSTPATAHSSATRRELLPQAVAVEGSLS